MKVVKLEFNLSDYAAQRGMNINSFKLEDKTTVNILSNKENNIADFYHMDNDYFLGAKGYRGKNALYNALRQMLKLSKNAPDPIEVSEAWKKSLKSK